MTERTQYNLSDTELLSGIIYAIVVSAENSAGVGPGSNGILFRREDGSKSRSIVHAQYIDTVPC